MSKPLMPKATAVWLIDNTVLTFEQIGAFTGLHDLEVQALADGDVSAGMRGLDPVQGGQLAAEEIKRCEADPAAQLQMLKSDLPLEQPRRRGPRYTPMSKRADKPDAIAWLLKNHPELNDAQIVRLIGTTKNTIRAIRERTHWNSANLNPRSPLEIGLCARNDLSYEIKRAIKAGRQPLQQEEVKETPPPPSPMDSIAETLSNL